MKRLLSLLAAIRALAAAGAPYIDLSGEPKNGG